MEPNTVIVSPGTNQSIDTQMIILLRSCLSDNPFGLATIGWWWLLEVSGSIHSLKMAWKVTYHRVAALRLSEWRAETVFAADDDHSSEFDWKTNMLKSAKPNKIFSEMKAEGFFSFRHLYSTPNSNILLPRIWSSDTSAPTLFSPPCQIQRRPRTDLVSWYFMIADQISQTKICPIFLTIEPDLKDPWGLGL